MPIDCSEQPGRYYVCPHGEGVPCVDGPSMLCDLKADCPGGNDEKEDACSKCFTLFSISYTADAVPLKKFLCTVTLKPLEFVHIHWIISASAVQ